MRIVITKYGAKFIEDLSLNNSIDYNSDTNQSIGSLNIIKSKFKNLKKNKSINCVIKSQKNKKLYTKSFSNLNTKSEKIDINNILTNNAINTNSNKEKENLNQNIKNLKLIQLKNKKFKLPKLIENKYILYDVFNQEQKNMKKNAISKVLLSINDSIDNANSHKKAIKRNKTINNIFTDDIEKEINKNINLNSNDNINNINNNNEIELSPKIRKTFPLKYIIDKDSYKRLNKEMKNLENCCNIEKKLFKNNYFLKNTWENSKKDFDLSLKNEINSKNVNLIEYLNKDKNISNKFIQKFSNLDEEKINKLDNISKKLLEKKPQDKQINNNIKNKIKTKIMNINIDFRQGLNFMNNRLNEYGTIIKKDKDKILWNDKSKYIEQFMDAEKNWEKYRLERLFIIEC